MRVLVTGGHNYHDKARLFSVLSKLDAKYPISVVTHSITCAADVLSDAWARAHGKDVLAFSAD